MTAPRPATDVESLGWLRELSSSDEDPLDASGTLRFVLCPEIDPRALTSTCRDDRCRACGSMRGVRRRVEVVQAQPGIALATQRDRGLFGSFFGTGISRARSATFRGTLSLGSPRLRTSARTTASL